MFNSFFSSAQEKYLNFKYSATTMMTNPIAFCKGAAWPVLKGIGATTIEVLTKTGIHALNSVYNIGKDIFNIGFNLFTENNSSKIVQKPVSNIVENKEVSNGGIKSFVEKTLEEGQNSNLEQLSKHLDKGNYPTAKLVVDILSGAQKISQHAILAPVFKNSIETANEAYDAGMKEVYKAGYDSVDPSKILEKCEGDLVVIKLKNPPKTSANNWEKVSAEDNPLSIQEFEEAVSNFNEIADEFNAIADEYNNTINFAGDCNEAAAAA